MMNQQLFFVIVLYTAASSCVNQWSHYLVLVGISLINQPIISTVDADIVLVANRYVGRRDNDAANRSVGLNNIRAARVVNHFDDFIDSSDGIINSGDQIDSEELSDYELQLKKMINYVTPLVIIFSSKHHKQKRWIEFDRDELTDVRRRRGKGPYQKVVKMRVVAVKRQGYGGGGGYSEAAGCCDYENYEDLLPLLALASLAALLFWLYLIKTTTTTTT
jgi:hypothetical protein